MVTRCGYYLSKSSDIIEYRVKIDWDLGFTTAAKHTYIDRMKDELRPCVGYAEDVTTASQHRIGRSLSPHILKRRGTNIDISSSFLNQSREKYEYEFEYFNSINEEQRNFILTTPCLFDVFYNPETAVVTQAMWLTIYRKLWVDGKEGLLNNLPAFAEWYGSVFYNIQICHKEY